MVSMPPEGVTVLASRYHGNNAKLDTLGKRIMDRFDMLIELNTDHSFVGRRKAVWLIGYFKYATLGVTLGALLLAFAITALLTRKIMKPLSAAEKMKPTADVTPWS